MAETADGATHVNCGDSSALATELSSLHNAVPAVRWAVAYTSFGWPVFPVKPAEKTPLAEHGVKDATCDPLQVGKWWHGSHDAGIGMATGEPSGLFVLDVDERHGGETSLAATEGEFEKLPPTLESITGGGGRHLFFKMPRGRDVRNSAGKIGKGLDIRGTGGYVVLPPSKHPSGDFYAWTVVIEPADAPTWLLEKICAPASLGATEEPECATAQISEGQRNATLTSLAGVMRRRGMTLEAIQSALLEENARRCDPPLPEIEVRQIAASVARYDPAPSRKRASSPEAPRWPAPLAPAAFHGLAGEIVRTIEPHTEADPAALLVQFLTGFGSVAGRSACFRVEADRHYGNTFAVLVGVTSVGRKGTSLGHVRSVLNCVDPDWEQRRVRSGLSSGEGLIWSVRDPIEKPHPIREKGCIVRYERILEDEGEADKRALIFEAEFSGPLRVMSRDGNTLSATVRDAFDRGDLSSLTKNSPARATGAHISIIGHVTRDELLRYLNSTEMGNGFANRFLWVCVRRSKCLPEGGNLRIEDHPQLIKYLRQGIAFSRETGEVRRDPEAAEIWRTIYPRISEGQPGLLGSIISRAPAQVVRLSLLYALLDCSAVIRPEHLRAALAVWDYCEASARFIFGDSLGYPVADRILAELQASPGGLTRTQIRDLFGRHRSDADVELALRCLAERSLAVCETIKTGGRSAEVWKPVEGATKATDGTKG